MTDLIERLRSAKLRDVPELLVEAADEIERLRGDRPDWAEYQRLINENREQQAEIERLQAKIDKLHEHCCPFCDMEAEIDALKAALQEQHDAINAHSAVLVQQRDEAYLEIKRLRASLNNDMFEKMADEIDSLETQIERLRDALYEIAHMDPIRRIQGDAQRVAKKALENKE